MTLIMNGPSSTASWAYGGDRRPVASPTFANADIANGEHQAARPGIFDLHLTTY